PGSGVGQTITDQRLGRSRGLRPRNDEPNHVQVTGPPRLPKGERLMSTALEGVRVLDMTHVQSGPSATQLLAWLGAEVIKLESPSGDITRVQLRDVDDADSLYFTMLNCNKRSITLNMKHPRGHEIFTRLIQQSD